MKPACLLSLVVALVSAPASADEAPPRYLTGASVNLVLFLPAPPTKGSYLEKRDLDVFTHHRAAVGSERWRDATVDVDESIDSILRDFSAPLGATLSPATHPVLAHLLVTMRRDVIAAIDAAKPRYARLRPFQLATGPVCQSKTDLAKSFDYPSGHATYGTSVALILAEIAPEHADAVLERGRVFGDSRFVCGAHSVSAVDAGRQAAAAIVAALHGSASFRSDLDKARAEFARTLS